MLNKLQEEAVSLAILGHNLFISGSAGTGKTHIVKEISNKLTSSGKTVAITCTTGIACSNFPNASTLHRWSGLHDGRFSSDELLKSVSLNEAALNRIRLVDTLIIDEISMLSKKLFEQLVIILTNTRDSQTFLGGVQLIVSGDFNQLAPVPNKRYNDNGDYCFLSPIFCQLHKVTLEDVVRQNDLELINAIRKVSVGGELDGETVAFIKTLSRPLKDDQVSPSVKLFSTNDLVNSYNREQIERHPGTVVEYVANDSGENKYLSQFTAPKRLWLKDNCPVVLIRNISDKLYNGLQGNVTGILSDGPQVYFPKLNCSFTIGKVTFSVFSPRENRVLASRKQVPLLLSYALTVHKAQGMTLDRVEIDCQQIFKPGQLGVAMGRVRNKDGLRVVNFTPNVCLPQPDEIKEYLTTTSVEPSEDLSCCTQMLRDPEETVETFWFGDEIENDVPVTEDDLEDDFNDVIASLIVGEGEIEQLPDGFEMENILNECLTEKPVTAVQEQVNVMTKDLLQNNINYCKSFCSSQIKAISNIVNNLQTAPGSQVTAHNLTEVYSDIHKYQLGESFRLSCLLMFEKYPDFSGAHSYICTKLTEGIRKFLIYEKTKLHEERASDDHERFITDASRARIRYVAGYCVSMLHKQYTTTYRSNMFSSSVTGQQRYFEAKEMMQVLNTLKEEERFLKMFSTDKDSLTDIDRRQYMTRGLVNVTDNMFEFTLQLCKNCLDLLVNKNLNVHGQDMYQFCQESILKSLQLLKYFEGIVLKNLSKENLQTFLDCSEEVVVGQVLSEAVSKVHSMHAVFKDLVSKFLMVMFNQFRKDLLHSFSVAKTMAHRKQILVRQEKKQTVQKSVSFNTIMEDKTEKKEMSHSLLRGLIMSDVKALEQMKKKEIEKIGKAYGIIGKQNTKKSVLIDIVKKVILDSSHMPHYEVFQEGPSHSKQTNKHPVSDPQPSTSSAHEDTPDF